MTVNWLAPVYNGNSAIVGYNLYRDSVKIATFRNVLTCTDNGRNNGTSNMAQNSVSGISYGDCAIFNVSVNAKSMSIAINSNGRAIENIYVIALDANPSHLLNLSIKCLLMLLHICFPILHFIKSFYQF